MDRSGENASAGVDVISLGASTGTRSALPQPRHGLPNDHKIINIQSLFYQRWFS